MPQKTLADTLADRETIYVVWVGGCRYLTGSRADCECVLPNWPDTAEVGSSIFLGAAYRSREELSPASAKVAEHLMMARQRGVSLDDSGCVRKQLQSGCSSWTLIPSRASTAPNISSVRLPIFAMAPIPPA